MVLLIIIILSPIIVFHVSSIISMYIYRHMMYKVGSWTVRKGSLFWQTWVILDLNTFEGENENTWLLWLLC